MRKLRRCEELITGNGHAYVLAGTFGNIEAAGFVCGDPALLFARLVDGEMPPGDIRSVILCCLEEVDGVPVDENSRSDMATEFVEDFGLQDCSMLCRHLISYGIIGNVKKKQIERSETVRGLVRKLRLSTLTRSGRRGWWWAASCATLIAAVCLTLTSV